MSEVRAHQRFPVLVALTCDRCGATHGNDDMGIERQEFLRYKDTAGYGSVFGDGNRLSVDLCQHCVKEALGQWLRVEEA